MAPVTALEVRCRRAGASRQQQPPCAACAAARVSGARGAARHGEAVRGLVFAGQPCRLGMGGSAPRRRTTAAKRLRPRGAGQGGLLAQRIGEASRPGPGDEAGGARGAISSAQECWAGTLSATVRALRARGTVPEGYTWSSVANPFI